jgi:hypothetical protein
VAKSYRITALNFLCKQINNFLDILNLLFEIDYNNYKGELLNEDKRLFLYLLIELKVQNMLIAYAPPKSRVFGTWAPEHCPETKPSHDPCCGHGTFFPVQYGNLLPVYMLTLFFPLTNF